METPSLKVLFHRHGVVVVTAMSIAFLALLPASVHEALLLRRGAIFEGELWRLWTGHWVHFGTSHLLWDLGSFLAAGLWLGELGARRADWFLMAVVAPMLGGCLLLVDRQLGIYGGLSGLVCAQCGALVALLWKRNRRSVALLLATLLIAKLCLDFSQGKAPLARFEGQEIRTVPWAHLIGALLGIPIAWLKTEVEQPTRA